MRRCILLPSIALFLAVAIARAPGARAQSASDQAAAEALFREGRKLYEAGRYADACPKFAESQRIAPAPGTLLNLAGCYEKNGQSASAWATFGLAAAEARRKGRVDWEQLARDRTAALEPTLSKLTIAVAAETPGLVVKRDGAEVGRAMWGAAIPVDPGAHVVEAIAPGRQPFRQTVEVAGAGATASVSVPALDPIASGTGAAAGDGSTQRTVAIAVAGVGVVGIAVGSVFGMKARSDEDDALTHCRPDSNLCTQQGVDLGNDAKSAATISTIAFVAGGAALAGGAVLWFTAPRSAPTTGLAVRATHGGLALGWEGAW